MGIARGHRQPSEGFLDRAHDGDRGRGVGEVPAQVVAAKEVELSLRPGGPAAADRPGERPGRRPGAAAPRQPQPDPQGRHRRDPPGPREARSLHGLDEATDHTARRQACRRDDHRSGWQRIGPPGGPEPGDQDQRPRREPTAGSTAPLHRHRGGIPQEIHRCRIPPRETHHAITRFKDLDPGTRVPLFLLARKTPTRGKTTSARSADAGKSRGRYLGVTAGWVTGRRSRPVPCFA